MAAPELSIIIVNWNVKLLLRACLQSLLAAEQAAPALSSEIIVVDSASSDGSPEMVRREFPPVKLIASQQNLGYAGGNNVGVEAARGRYLFLLNPDTVVDAEAPARLVTYLAEQPSVGAVGPQLRWPDGSIQSSRRRFPSPGSLFWESTLLEQWFPHNRYSQRYRLADQPPERPQRVDWLVGAALLIRRTAWQQVGPLDEDYFMYFEETDWCRRAAAAGWEIHYLPAARVTHYEGQSSQQVVARRILRFQRSKLRYATKYFGPGWAASLRWFLKATYGWQGLGEGAKWLVGHRRSLRQERLQAYRQLLREL